jgi:beta-phosphoglucomutase
MNQPFAVIFDMDGVLVDTNPYHKIAIDQFCKKYGFHLAEDELRNRVYGRTNRQWITNLFGSITEAELEAYAIEKEQLFRDLYTDHIQPVKGLINFLDQLVAHNIPRCIATSAPRANVDFVLERTGTQTYFDIILDERMVTRGKPDPEIYHKSAQALGLPNAQCIVIEDSLSGVEAGKNSGSKVIGITTTHTAEELIHTDLVITDFDDLTLEDLSNLIHQK